MVAHWRRCVGSLEKMWWLKRGDVVADWEDVVAQWRRCGGSLVKMWWLIGEDVVAHW